MRIILINNLFNQLLLGNILLSSVTFALLHVLLIAWRVVVQIVIASALIIAATLRAIAMITAFFTLL